MLIIKDFVDDKETTAHYINQFDIACNKCGTIKTMAIKGHYNYCHYCGSQIRIKENNKDGILC